MPIFEGMHKSYEGLHDFKVLEGYSAETSGGILALLDSESADLFMAEAVEVYG